MSVQRYFPSTIGTAFTGMVPAVFDGDYVLHSDYAALEARCAGLERALVEISKLPYCDSYMCRQIARAALADTTTGEVQP